MDFGILPEQVNNSKERTNELVSEKSVEYFTAYGIMTFRWLKSSILELASSRLDKN